MNTTEHHKAYNNDNLEKNEFQYELDKVVPQNVVGLN